LEFLDSVDNYFPVYYSFVYRYHDKDPKLAGTMYNLLLWQKGFIAGSIADMRRKIEASGDTEALKLLEELAAKRSQMAALLNVRPPDRDLWRKQIEQLRADSAEIEKALVARSAAFAEKRKLDRATWQQVRDALAPGEAAVEFARFRYFDKDWTSRAYYVALVLTHETKDAPQYIVLGDDKQVEDGAVIEFRQGLQTRGLAAEQETGIPGAHAWDLIWKPLEAALMGKSRLYVSPDGMLNEVPLGIVPASDGTLAMERFDLRVLSSTKDILRSKPSRASATALLMGDPAFDLFDGPAKPKLESAVLEENGHVEEKAATLPPLPGTGAEVAAIADLMRSSGWKVGIYTREAASKRVIEQADSPRVMHLATHGFFLPDQQTRMAKLGLEQEQAPGVADPMLRSGLYFAGADRGLDGRAVPDGTDNGVLTAMEVGNLNLAGTELVVLSACNTGKGDVKAGEGVFGLRRALQEAGAQAVLMSMWSVPDKQTMELMQRFYTKWLAGTEMHQALKDAQLEIREQVKREHGGRDLPYYWGAFVLVGR
jgi:CHAT domain-containing protein